MKKGWMVFSLVLAFLGLLMIPSGFNYKSLKFIPDGSKSEEEINAWSISRTFEEGRLLVFELNPNPSWGSLAYDFKGSIPPGFSDLSDFLETNPYIYLIITVIDPLGRETNFTALYTVHETTDPLHPFHFTLFGVAVTSNKGGLSFDGLTLEREGEFLYLDPRVVSGTLFGITVSRGIYRVSFMDYGLAGLGDPLKLKLSSFLVVEEKPYFFLVPSGGFFLALSIFSFYWAKRSVPRKVKKKEKFALSSI